MADAPVLIVGGGPVGLVAALLLARQGVPSVVLESAPARSAVGSRSLCVQRDVLDVLERVGVGRQVVDAGVTWYRGRIFYREHEVVAHDFPESPTGAFPPFVNTPQMIVERLLEQRVATEPLIDLRYSHLVTALEQDEKSVTVEVSTPAGHSRLTGTHCIAADGARSTVRRLLDLSFDGYSVSDQFLIADIRAALGLVPERRFHFDPPWNPGRQVLVHPQPDGVWRIDWQVSEEFDLETERANGKLDERIRTVLGPLDYEQVWVSVYRFHQRRVSRMRDGRVLLAGDCAHVMSPFGARGLNSGICDAENAAWKIAFDRAGLGGPGLLESYHLERAAAADENLRVTATTMRFLVPSTPAEREYRSEVLARAVHDPTARSLIDSGRLAEPFYYLESPLTTRDLPAEADFPREPGAKRPVIPGVLCPDVRLPGGDRLRPRFGPGFTVLGDVPITPGGGTAVLPPRERGLVELVRPDGHLAAVFAADAPAGSIEQAWRLACGWPSEAP